MTHSRSPSFKALPVRVALTATAVVAVVYAVASIAVLGISQNALNANIDARLARQLVAIQTQPDSLTEAFGGEAADLDNDGDARRFDAPLLVWVRSSDGEQFQSDPSAPLPGELATVSGPVAANIVGTDMRLVGGPLASDGQNGWITIAQSVGETTRAVNTLVLAEVVIAPLLLLLVFGGSLLIGRRVAAPIEQARLAQLAFTADASHELRTPLTVIDAETAIGLEREQNAESRQTLERIRSETRTLRSLVDDLLWLARFDSAPRPPEAEAVDIGVLARTAADRFRPIARARGTSIEVAVDGPAAPVVTGPPEWLSRALSVLVDNAVRHTPPGSRVWIKVHGERGRVELAVEDDGPGIPNDQRTQVFNRFHRSTDAREGSGLGLSIADAVVGRTHGHWQVGESASGGARMAVSWPRSSVSAVAQSLDAEEDDADSDADAEDFSSEPRDARNQGS